MKERKRLPPAVMRPEAYHITTAGATVNRSNWFTLWIWSSCQTTNKALATAIINREWYYLRLRFLVVVVVVVLLRRRFFSISLYSCVPKTRGLFQYSLLHLAQATGNGPDSGSISSDGTLGSHILSQRLHLYALTRTIGIY